MLLEDYTMPGEEYDLQHLLLKSVPTLEGDMAIINKQVCRLRTVLDILDLIQMTMVNTDFVEGLGLLNIPYAHEQVQSSIDAFVALHQVMNDVRDKKEVHALLEDLHNDISICDFSLL